MKIEELKKYVIHELEWLRYYALEDSRKKLNNESSIYDQLVSIGYTKRVIPLPNRCSAAWIKMIDNNIELSKEYPRCIEKNIYTPLEVWLKLYPESFDEVKRYLLREINNIS